MTDAPESAAEADILMPDRDITVSDPETGADVLLTVKEYRFRDGLRAQFVAQELIADLARLSGDAAELTVDGLHACLGAHADAWLELCSIATERAVEWIACLQDSDAQTLSMAVWEANSGFFLSRILAVLGSPDPTLSGSLTSSPASPAPATAQRRLS